MTSYKTATRRSLKPGDVFRYLAGYNGVQNVWRVVPDVEGRGVSTRNPSEFGVSLPGPGDWDKTVEVLSFWSKNSNLRIARWTAASIAYQETLREDAAPPSVARPSELEEP